MFMMNQTIGMNQVPQQQQQPLLPPPNGQILRSSSNPSTPNQHRHQTQNPDYNIITPSSLPQSKSAMNVQPPTMSTYNSDRTDHHKTSKLKISTKHLRKSKSTQNIGDDEGASLTPNNDNNMSSDDDTDDDK